MRRSAVVSIVLLAVWWSAQAHAQPIPDALKNEPRNTPFLKMPPGPNNSCQVGTFKSGGRSGAFCDVSIDECASIPHTHIARDFQGNWGCLR